MATPSRTKKVLFTALAGIGATAGAAGIASAATSQTTPTDPAAVEQPAVGQDTEQGDQNESPNYTASITVPQTPDGADGTEDEAGEAAKLAPLATTTADEAAAAAIAAVPGTAGTPQLGDENGNVVYEVEVTKADGSKVEVKVDAGNAKVLAQESGDEGNEKGDNEANEAGPETADPATPAN